MRFIRPMVYSVMAIVIGTSAFLLTTKQATSQTDSLTSCILRLILNRTKLAPASKWAEESPKSS